MVRVQGSGFQSRFGFGGALSTIRSAELTLLNQHSPKPETQI